MKGQRILVVEDEPVVRKLTVALLSHAGFEAVAVSDGAQALEVLEGEEEFDVVLSDASMPGLSGSELLAALRSRNLGMPFVLMSGFADDRFEIPPSHRASHLAKPFDGNMLVDAVRSALTTA
ncbi:MAG TPA: response regulator [Polyangiaceae bacterium]|nr:response regulator [Polyangiaceae bacterium]